VTLITIRSHAKIAAVKYELPQKATALVAEETGRKRIK